MAIVTGTYETFTAIGQREDLSDIVFNIDPVERPFMSSVSRGTASAVLHEWQTDVLDTADFNAQLEGDDTSFAAITPTVRPTNRTQISNKSVIVSGTLDAVDKAGRGTELSYQIARLSKSLMRDMEFTVTRNQAINAGVSDMTARALASYECWITGANASRGATGADATITAGTPVDAPMDGTQRALLESMMKSVIQNVWNSGGTGELIITGPFNKTVVSSFSGNSTRFDRGEDKRLVTAIDIYVSDFHDGHKVVADRFSRDRSLLVVTQSLWSLDYLRPFSQVPLAKTGDATKRLLLVEYTLRSSNRAGSGVVADLTTA
jgi:hypothetical protein